MLIVLKKFHKVALFIALFIFTSNCNLGINNINTSVAIKKNYKITISGQVEFPSKPEQDLTIIEIGQKNGNKPIDNQKIPNTGRGVSNTPSSIKIKAIQEEISSKATISLIYPHDYPITNLRNVTAATGMTDSNGFFSIRDNSNFLADEDDIFILEATKRIEGSGNNIALRTILKWNGTGFESITTPKIMINSKTTALSLISSLRPDILSTSETIGKLNVVNEQINIPDINEDVNSQTVIYVKALVEQAFTANYDPVAVVGFENDKYFLNPNGKTAMLLGCGGDCGAKSIPMPVYTPVVVPTIEPTASPSPYDDGFDHRIMFTGYVINETETDYIQKIFSINADGTDVLDLSVNEIVDNYSNLDPVITDYGTQIAYKKNGQLYIMNADGTNKHKFFTDSENLNYNYDNSLSMSGNKLLGQAFNEESGGNDVVISEGADLTYLTNDSFDDFSPVFSPDGSKIAFLTNKYVEEQSILELNIINLSDNTKTKVYESNRYISPPQWSPDGTKLLSHDDNESIYIIKADGSLVNNIPNPRTNYVWGINNPRWSYDSNRIFFMTVTNINNGSHSIASMKDDGTDLDVITLLRYEYSNPLLSADGKYIGFKFYEPYQHSMVYVMDTDGSNMRRIADSFTNNINFKGWVKVNRQ